MVLRAGTAPTPQRSSHAPATANTCPFPDDEQAEPAIVDMPTRRNSSRGRQRTRQPAAALSGPSAAESPYFTANRPVPPVSPPRECTAGAAVKVGAEAEPRYQRSPSGWQLTGGMCAARRQSPPTVLAPLQPSCFDPARRACTPSTTTPINRRATCRTPKPSSCSA